MMLLVGDNTRIPMSDEQLDRFAEAFQQAASEGTGVWIVGDLISEVDGQLVDPDPDDGHQRFWVHTSQLVSLVYDRPQDSEPAVGGNVIPFGPRRK